ncbi:hypothetical protein ACWEVD_10130 [Nocardia thailandica]
MSSDPTSDRRGPRGPHSPHADGLAEFTEELRLLAEALLERVEPVLRRTAVDGRPDLGGCGWCPMCAAAALVRGDHHDVVAALAEHGTALVTILREALAGVPVDPLLPPEWDEHHAGHDVGSEFDSAASAFVRGYSEARAQGHRDADGAAMPGPHAPRPDAAAGGRGQAPRPDTAARGHDHAPHRDAAGWDDAAPRTDAAAGGHDRAPRPDAARRHDQGPRADAAAGRHNARSGPEGGPAPENGYRSPSGQQPVPGSGSRGTVHGDGPDTGFDADRPGAGVGLWSTRYARPDGTEPVSGSFASFVPDGAAPTGTGRPPVGRARVQPPTPPSGIPATEPPADAAGRGRHRSGPPRVTPDAGDATGGRDAGRARARSGGQAAEDARRSARAPRSRYVDIPVTIRG